MGLDMVEIMMTVEETFQVSIPEADAAKLQTVGQMFEYLKERCHRMPFDLDADNIELTAWDDARAWRMLQDLVVEQLNIDRDLVTREARFIQDLGAG